MPMNIKSELKRLKFNISAVLFDWGNTIMPIFPDQFGPMAMWERLELIRGAEQILPQLQQKYSLALLSNADDSDRELVGKALLVVGAAKYFSHIFTPQELIARKPAPQFYHNALKKIGVEPEHAIMVGDDYEKDIIGAKQAGLWTIWFNQNGKTTASKYPYHDFEINSLLQIPEILERKFKRQANV
ncbi:MAG: HAD family hydrolase [Calditrichaeota bacterium]|nr:HAD family hydrolase [Calditrichota bacterium]